MDNTGILTREELITSDEYLLGNVQYELYEDIKKYLDENKMTQTEFADKLGFHKSYISQILNGNFDHKHTKLIQLYRAIGWIVTGVQKIELASYLALDKAEPDKLELNNLMQREYAYTEHKFDFEHSSDTKLIRLDQRERSYSATEGAI